jgi:hypothetical protein
MCKIRRAVTNAMTKSHSRNLVWIRSRTMPSRVPPTFQPALCPGRSQILSPVTITRTES